MVGLNVSERGASLLWGSCEARSGVKIYRHEREEFLRDEHNSLIPWRSMLSTENCLRLLALLDC